MVVPAIDPARGLSSIRKLIELNRRDRRVSPDFENLVFRKAFRNPRFQVIADGLRGAALLNPHLLEPHARNIACPGARRNRSSLRWCDGASPPLLTVIR